MFRGWVINRKAAPAVRTQGSGQGGGGIIRRHNREAESSFRYLTPIVEEEHFLQHG